MNVKQGDLAVVIRCRDYPQAIGRVVDVVSPHKNIPDAWVIRFKGSTPEGIDCMKDGVVGVMDHCLKPVSGLPMEEEHQEELPV